MSLSSLEAYLDRTHAWLSAGATRSPAGEAVISGLRRRIADAPLRRLEDSR